MENFSWTPLYTELAKKLLYYKDNRSALVNWIYEDLGKVTRDDGKSLVAYLKMKDGSKIQDIDPFSVFGIFNRGISWEKRTELLQKFKVFFNLESDVPSDFNGIPTLDARRSFFFSWYDDNDKVIQGIWDLYEKIIQKEDAETAFNKVIENGMARYSLTMCLFWIAPQKFLSLDSRNRSYLETYGFAKEYPTLRYADYLVLLNEVQKAMDSGSIPASSFIDFSHMAWKASTESPKVWMWNGDENTFLQSELKAGISAKGLLDFASYKSKDELGKAYRAAIGNTDVKIPYAYWDFIHNAKIGDVVVVFGTRKESGKKHHKLYGWGRFTSNCFFDNREENPIQRSVAWHLPPLANPIDENKTKNDIYFHLVEGIEADNIIRLLQISDDATLSEAKTNRSNLENKDMAHQEYKEYIDLLLDNHNLILTGAPGTGKTYMAKKIAEEMEAEWEFVQFHPSYDYTDFVEGLRPVGDNGNFGFELRSGVFKDFCARALKNQIDSKKSIHALQQESSARDKIDGYLDEVIESGKTFNTFGTKNVFHVIENNEKTVIVEVPANEKTSTVKLPKSDLIALVENDVPVKNGKDLQAYFGRKHGTQQDAYVRVLYNYIKGYQPTIISADVSLVKLKKFVFIIDEINRGDISKIFGELFFSIDPGYRGEQGKVYTQYQNMIPDDDVFKKGFFVPENVYILATMNDIDRSVESMDFAMRRRFNWKEVTPAETQGMLDTLPCAADAIATMQRLNLAIADTDGLGAAYMIGPSYFLKLNDNGYDFNKLWKMNIEPLLKEYLRGFRKSAEILDKFSKAFFNTNDSQTNDNPE